MRAGFGRVFNSLDCLEVGSAALFVVGVGAFVSVWSFGALVGKSGVVSAWTFVDVVLGAEVGAVFSVAEQARKAMAVRSVNRTVIVLFMSGSPL